MDERKPVTDITLASIFTSIHDNDVEYWKLYKHPKKLKLHDEGGICWLSSPIPHSIFNGVVRSQLQTDKVETQILELKAFFASHRLPWQWLIGLDANSSSLENSLSKHGLIRLRDMSGMAISLQEVGESTAKIDNFDIVFVDNTDLMREWVRIAGIVFDIPISNLFDFLDIELSLGFGRNLPVRRFIGLLNGTPVATSALCLRAGVGGIYWVATLPETRQRGIGTAMTRKALTEARDCGYQLGILQAGHSSARIYQKIGFKEYYKIQVYYMSVGT
jgi:ribosomal protein S18 acetylase RimI-like enzyme